MAPRCLAVLPAPSATTAMPSAIASRTSSSSGRKRSSNTCRSSTASTQSSRCSVTISMPMTAIGLKVTSSPSSGNRSAQLVLCEQAAHGLDQRCFLDGELRLGLLLQIFVAVLGRGQCCSQDQVLDLDFAARFLVAALNDGARRVPLVGVFELRPDIVFRIAEIELGTDVRRAQGGHHALII